MKHTVKVSHRLVIDGQTLLALIRDAVVRDQKRRAAEPDRREVPSPESMVRLVGPGESEPRPADQLRLEISWED